MGTPALRSGLARAVRSSPGQALLTRLLRELPGVGVRVIADPALRESAGAERAESAGAGGAEFAGAESSGADGADAD